RPSIPYVNLKRQFLWRYQRIEGSPPVPSWDRRRDLDFGQRRSSPMPITREGAVAMASLTQQASQVGQGPKPPAALEAPLPFLLREGQLHDEQVLSFAQWCALNGISKRTGRRLLAAGDGPVVTQLSEKRIGITVRNNRAWQASRARS